MEWINSRGGPLICAETHIAAQWMGIRGLSAVNRVAKSDYERACAAIEYLQPIPCGTEKVLVLGDEPLQSTFLTEQDGQQVIARWVYAQSHQLAEAALAKDGAEAFEISPRVKFRVNGGIVVLFDAALPGSEATQAVRSNIEPGRYEVTTEKLEINRVYSFLIHRFIKENG
jgi:immunity protein 21 of polymorphic toxin system